MVAKERLVAVSRWLSGATMDGSASVRKSLSGTLVPSSTTTVAVLEKTEEQSPDKQNKKVLDDDEYVKVSSDDATEDDRHVYDGRVGNSRVG